jgi:radical SAM superfamily enzyme YgiQ (UPF0313 family)
MNVLLIQPPHKGRSPSLFPIGIGYVAKSLMDIGCKVDILDIHAEGIDKDEVCKRIAKLKTDLVGINAFSTQYKYIRWLAPEIKRCTKVPIVLGGPLATHNSELVLKNTDVDICVVGEGDITIKDLVKEEDLHRVKGICFKEDGQVINNPPREEIVDLDGIGLIPYEIFHMDVYFRYIRLWGGNAKRVINLITSRGCPYNCNFCSRTFQGVRYRSINNVVSEIKVLKGKYNIEGILFNDELVIACKKRAYELCEEMMKIGVQWGCQGRANLVDPKLLKTMKKAGCVYVGYGIESGSQKVLNNMNKKVTVEQDKKAIIDTLKAGMVPVAQMIFGYPGEDVRTVQETIDFYNEVHYSPPTPEYKPAELNLITPLPGSSLYDYCIQSGKILDEEEYLLKIEKGYDRGCPLLVNFTDFPDDELLRLKDETEEIIYTNYRKYLRRHPILFGDNLFRKIISYRCAYGYKKLVMFLMSRFAETIRFWWVKVCEKVF